MTIAIIKKADETLNQRSTTGLSNDKIIAGLKEALQVSTGKAVALTGKPDDFLKNEAITILLPPKLETVGRGMRMLGMGAKVDELEVGMNRAAEQATPEAKQIFIVAVKKMSLDDARAFLALCNARSAAGNVQEEHHRRLGGGIECAASFSRQGADP